MQKVPGGNGLLNPVELLKRAGVAYRMTVADLGCGGQGFFALQASDMIGEDGTVYAVDILKSALTSVTGLAKQGGVRNIKTVWSNVEIFGATKIPDGVADVALLVNMLFQSKKRAEILREAARLVKKGGKILVVDWKATDSPLGPPLNVRINPKELLDAGHALGLTKVDEFDAGQFHWGIIFAK